MASSIRKMSDELVAGLKLLSKPKDATSLGLVVAAVVCAIAPLDVSQLMFAVAGAVGFSVIQMMQSKARTATYTHAGKKLSPSQAKVVDHGPQDYANKARKMQGLSRQVTRKAAPPPAAAVRPQSQPEVRKPSSVPILAPTFEGTNWEAQVTELLGQIMPTIDDDKIVGRLARRVEDVLRPILPEVEVVGFASGSLARNKAFGVAVPEVDIVANVNPVALMKRLGGKAGNHAVNSDAHKLRKLAIRACTDRLVSMGGFKFRRSAFRGEEPKVTLLAPASFGLSNDAIPIDFSVNAAVPLYNAALLTECGQINPRARALILLVKRWAKDRGVCHAAKGHLSPYTWGLLCIFFLQAGRKEGALLPSVSSFKMASGLMKQATEDQTWSPPTGQLPSVGQLFKDFVHFYNVEFDWRSEAVSVRTAKRDKPGLTLPLHVILHDDGSTTEVGPSIEDPFDEARNLGSSMNAASLARLREELSRAEEYCSKDISLADLLEPWAPPAPEEEPEKIDG